MKLTDFMTRFPDDDACRAHLESVRWPDGPVCARCGSLNKAAPVGNRPGFWRCGPCGKQFSVTAGTPMHGTHLGLRTWFIAMYLILASSKGVSAVKLGEMLGVQYRTAWHLGHRIRAMIGSGERLPLEGVVEADETYVGGKARNIRQGKERPTRGRGTPKKDTDSDPDPRCTKCGTIKQQSSFRPRKFVCRACDAERAREWFRLNNERAKAAARERYARDPKAILTAQKARDPDKGSRRYRANPEKAKKAVKDWAVRNPEVRNFHYALRRSRKYKACPKWLNKYHIDQIVVIYREASLKKEHVDHIIPLAGCARCGAHGLHVPWNLQLLSPSANASKRNLCDNCWDAARGGGRARARPSHGGPPANVALARAAGTNP